MKRSSKYYIDTIKAALILKHSEVDEETGEVELNPEFEILLDMLVDNLDLLSECRKSIKKVGIYDVQTKKRNPLLTVQKETQATIIKLLSLLAIPPYYASKIKSAKENGDDISADEFIKALTSSNYEGEE
nr:MAG TPA: terminase small subunit [Caudoviricetes sp.]